MLLLYAESYISKLPITIEIRAKMQAYKCTGTILSHELSYWQFDLDIIIEE